MPHGHGRQHTLLEMYGHVGHASAETARAEAALLAGERYDLGIAAAPAHDVQTALFDHAALPVPSRVPVPATRAVLPVLSLCRIAAHSGWRVFSGEETQDYADDATNFAMYNASTIWELDPSIVPLLTSPWRGAFERAAGRFVEVPP